MFSDELNVHSVELRLTDTHTHIQTDENEREKAKRKTKAVPRANRNENVLQSFTRWDNGSHSTQPTLLLHSMIIEEANGMICVAWRYNSQFVYLQKVCARRLELIFSLKFIFIMFALPCLEGEDIGNFPAGNSEDGQRRRRTREKQIKKSFEQRRRRRKKVQEEVHENLPNSMRKFMKTYSSYGHRPCICA